MHELDNFILEGVIDASREVVNVIIEAYCDGHITCDEKNVIMESLKADIALKAKEYKDTFVNSGKPLKDKETLRAKMDSLKYKADRTAKKMREDLTHVSAKAISSEKGQKAISNVKKAIEHKAVQKTADAAKAISKNPMARSTASVALKTVAMPAVAVSGALMIPSAIAAGVGVTMKSFTEKDLNRYNTWKEMTTKFTGTAKFGLYNASKVVAFGPVDWLITAAFAVQLTQFDFKHDEQLRKIINTMVNALKSSAEKFKNDVMRQVDANTLQADFAKVDTLGAKLAGFLDGIRYLQSHMDKNTSRKKQERRKEANRARKREERRKLATATEMATFEILDEILYENGEISTEGYAYLQEFIERTDPNYLDVEFIVEDYLTFL